MKKIPITLKVPNKKQAIYLALFATDSTPWKHAENIDERKRDLQIPRILMVHRAEETIGFIGGIVEEGEMFEETLRRKANQEIGYILDTRYDLEPIVAYELPDVTTHIYMQNVPFTFLEEINRQACQGKSFGTEITGTFLPHLYDYESVFGYGGGLINFLKSNMAEAVREEIVSILLSHNYLSVDIVSNACIRAGYKLSELIQ